MLVNININNMELKNKKINNKIIKIDNKLLLEDGYCVICEDKYKEGYRYYGYYCDEIVLGKRKLCSGYYLSSKVDNYSRIIFKNLNSALKEIKKGNYNNFENLIIKKIKLKNNNNKIIIK